MKRLLCRKWIVISSFTAVTWCDVPPQKHELGLDLTRNRHILEEDNRNYLDQGNLACICWFSRSWWPLYVACLRVLGLQSSGSLRSFGRSNCRSSWHAGGVGGSSLHRHHTKGVFCVVLASVLGDAGFCCCRSLLPRRKQDITAATSRLPPWS